AGQEPANVTHRSNLQAEWLRTRERAQKILGRGDRGDVRARGDDLHQLGFAHLGPAPSDDKSHLQSPRGPWLWSGRMVPRLLGGRRCDELLEGRSSSSTPA